VWGQYARLRGRANGVCLPRQGRRRRHRDDGQRSWFSAPKTGISPVWVFPTAEQRIGVLYIARAPGRPTAAKDGLYATTMILSSIMHTHTYSITHIKRYYINVCMCLCVCLCVRFGWFFSFRVFLSADPSCAFAPPPPPPPSTKSIDRPTPAHSYHIHRYIIKWVKYTRTALHILYMLTGLRLLLLLFYNVQLGRALIPPSIRVVVR